MRGIRSFMSGAIFTFLLGFCLLLATPLVAYAISDNPAGTTLEFVNNGETMETNNGTIQTNNGTVTTNNGTIENNYSLVRENNGTIINNYSYNTNPDNGSGTIQNNYLVRAATTTDSGWNLPELWGTQNNYYRIPNQPELDWSLNPANFSSPLYLYIGASSNIDGQKGAIFKASEGYRITLKSTNNPDFKVTDNGDGTFTITVTNPNYRGTEINISDAISIEKLISVSVNAAPAEGGSIVYAGTNEAFVSGSYSHNTSLSLEAKANEGYRFVGWVGVQEQAGLSAEGNKLIIRPYMNYDWERIQSISCMAEFEKIPSSNNDSSASTAGSTNNSNNKSDNSESVLPPTSDTTFGVFILLGIVAAVASIFGFVALRKQA